MWKLESGFHLLLQDVITDKGAPRKSLPGKCTWSAHVSYRKRATEELISSMSPMSLFHNITETAIERNEIRSLMLLPDRNIYKAPVQLTSRNIAALRQWTIWIVSLILKAPLGVRWNETKNRSEVWRCDQLEKIECTEALIYYTKRKTLKSPGSRPVLKATSWGNGIMYL